MENTYKELRPDTELQAAALLQAHVYVVATPSYDEDETVDFGGAIEAYTPVTARIRSLRYLRNYHSVRINKD